MKAESVAEKIKKFLSRKGMGAVLLGLFAGVILLVLPSSEKNEIDLEPSRVMTGTEYCALLEEKAENS